MKEAFLHHIWKLQYFNQGALRTACGKSLSIMSTGSHNHHDGPDFMHATIKIGEITWVGNIEIHIKSSDWFAHKHQYNPAYNNVILHVVWENNGRAATTHNDVALPVFELKDVVEKELINRYEILIGGKDAILCSTQFTQVPELYIKAMQDRVLAERLERKSGEVLHLLKQNNNDWEETAYQLLMKYMGFKVNSSTFLQLATILPYRILKKQQYLIQIEALLYGQAGFLNTTIKDSYHSKLKKEYEYLLAKYKIANNKIQRSQWRFMRLRPPNFPTIRIAQVATILYHHKKIFDTLTNAKVLTQPHSIFQVTTTAYWQKHYDFTKEFHSGTPKIGKTSQELLFINVVVPLLVAKANYLDSGSGYAKGLALLMQLRYEDNKIIRKWKALNAPLKYAADSQAFIELFENYCEEKKCLECTLGNYLLKR
ncbi:MAG: DUF2851 family protein [Bacteroidota bacterium]